MGVDFLICNRCSDTFPDCGSYVSCDCWRKWCSDDCAGQDGFLREEDYEEDGEWYEGHRTCKYCRHEDADDSTLFLFLLTKLGVSREEVLAEWSG